MNSFLLWLGGLMVVVLGALFAVPHFVDWNIYRGVLEEEASRVLGREVRVGGAVNVRLLPVPYLSFERLRVADPGSFSGQPLFRVESVTMWLAVPPLLRGVLEANQVELRRPEVRLAVDAGGLANWSQLSIRKGELPFVPADVALRAVNIVDGRFSIERTAGGELARIEGIEGTLSGEAIEGPYKFAGKALWNGTAREVRLATAQPDADGGVRFKTTVSVVGSANTYTLDGRIADLKGAPALVGELSARIDPAAIGLLLATEAKTPLSPSERPMLDVKSRVDGNLTGVRLADMVWSFENVGQPQLLTGEASASWGEAPMLSLALASRWLDIDRLAGAGGTAQPVATTLQLTQRILAAVPAGGNVSANLVVDQISVGGEAVSGLDVALAREDDTLRLKAFRAGLPGGAHIDLEGEITPGERWLLRGPLTIGGTSLQRMLAWATRSQDISRSFPDGAFAFEGQLGIDDAAIEISQARGELAGTPLSGSVKVQHGERRRVAIELVGNRIDTGWLWPGGRNVLDLGAMLVPAATGSGSMPAAAPAWYDPKSTDLDVRLLAGHLVDGARTLDDVSLDLSLSGERVAIDDLRFGAADGLSVSLEGEVTRNGASRSGELRGVVSAPTGEALATLLGLAGMDRALPEAAQLAKSLVPLDTAATLSLSRSGQGSFKLVLDGAGAGGRLVGSLALDRIGPDWRAAPMTGSLALTGIDLEQVLSRAVADAGRRPAAGVEPQGELVLDVAGVPSSGLLTSLVATGADLALGYRGRLRLGDGGWLDADGEVEIDAGDAGMLVGWTGLDARAGEGASARGSLGLSRRDGRLVLKPAGLSLSGARISGEIAVAPATERPQRRIEADVTIDHARIPGLLGMLLDRRPGGASPDADVGSVIWPDEPFRSVLLEGLGGHVKARIASLELGAGAAVADAIVEAAIEPTRVTVSRLEGKALGGRLSATLTLEKAAAGAELSGRVAITDGRLEALGARDPGAVSRARGPVSLELDFNSKALGPLGLVSALGGKGEAKIGAAEIEGLSPASIALVADGALAGRIEATGEALRGAISAELHRGRLPLGPSEIPVEIVDGALHLAVTTIETSDGATSVTTTLDLAALAVDSEWSIEARGRRRAAGRDVDATWPAVRVVYAGRIADVSALEPQIDLAAFERELTVRRMELEVDELERLRRLDEERLQKERARRKALEEERALGAPGDPASWAPASPQAPGPPVQAVAPPDGSEPLAPSATIERQPLAPVAPARPVAPQAGSPAAAPPPPRPAAPRAQSRPPPTAAETTLQGLTPGLQ